MGGRGGQLSEHHAEGVSPLRKLSFPDEGTFLLKSRSELGHWVKKNSRPREAQSGGTKETQAASTSAPEEE